MKIPSVQSCGCFDLRTAGLMIGFLQVFFHGLAILFQLRYGEFFVVPISLAAMTMNILWIYGIQEKKVILMLPSLIFPVLVSLAGISFIVTFPILMAIATFGGGFSDNFRASDTGIALGVWFGSCIITGLFSYVSIVQYSLCKSLEESRHHKAHLPSAPMHEIPLHC